MIDSAPARLPLLLLLHLLALLALAPPRAAQDTPERARQLFVTNCASCHGERGDGQGTTELDRPARSFQDGGFSFGNTPEALFRTISTGIPGTPMAGFDASLSEAERKLLADYVVTLGPPIEAVADEDMILAVHERPLVVRGLLPPLGEGLPSHPRGLLIGDPSGITFEYRVDDVRLLALRQGGFVKRTDWTGRGGTSLEPLGKVVHLVEGGKPAATFLAGGKELLARLSSTRTGAEPTIEYHLGNGQRELAHVEEGAAVVTTEVGTGYARRFRFAALASALELRALTIPAGKLVANGTWDPRGKPKERFFVVRPDEGPPLYVSMSPAAGVERSSEGPLTLVAKIAPATRVEERVLTLVVLTHFDGEVLKKLELWREGSR
jgi:mono/diheme cytochrome c family protein